MTTYAQVINSNGAISIDDTTARLVKTRSIQLPDDGYSTASSLSYRYIDDSANFILGSMYVTTINLDANESLVSVRALADHPEVAVLGGFVSEKTYNIYLWGSLVDQNPYASDFVADVYGTVSQEDVSSHGYGLQIFNANRKKIFDSNSYCLDIVGTYDVIPSHYLNQFYYASQFDQTASIGNYTRSEHGVIINSCSKGICRPSRGAHDMMAWMSMGIVFNNNSIYLKKMCTGYLIYNTNTMSPYGLTGLSSGIIINTQNIT